MIQRFVAGLFAVGVVFAVACIDMSAPKGAASISVLQLASPSVVVGDTLRDSLGAVVPLKVLAYDAANNPIADASAQVFFTDTTTAGRLTPANVLIGDKIGIVHLVGQIGNLQTPVVNVPVTYLPVAIAPSATVKPDTARPNFLEDSLGSLGTSILAVRVRSAADSGSQGIIVRYAIVYAPATRPDAKLPAVFLSDDGGKPASSDTTDATGAASRRLTVLPRSLADGDLISGKKIDSAVVEIRASYKGIPLANSPIKFVIPIKSK